MRHSERCPSDSARNSNPNTNPNFKGTKMGPDFQVLILWSKLVCQVQKVGNSDSWNFPPLIFLRHVFRLYLCRFSIPLVHCVYAAPESRTSYHLQLSSCAASAAPAEGSCQCPTPWVGAKGTAGTGWLLASNAEFGSAYSSARPWRS